MRLMRSVSFRLPAFRSLAHAHSCSWTSLSCFFSLYAGSNFSRQPFFYQPREPARSLEPPSLRDFSAPAANSHTSIAQAGIMNTVSRSGLSLRFINAICSSYS